MTSTRCFDYIVIGGGIAGCVLAARLSEDSRVSVLLLEAGPEPHSLWITMPAGMGRLFVNGTYNWGYMCQPEAMLGGRTPYLPQGKTLGGSGAINGMAFVRGHSDDYDEWRDLGNPGWSWADVEPCFRKLETRTGNASASRGDSGPLRISDPSYIHSSSRAFVAAAINAGLPRNADFNGGSQEGASFLQYTIHEGRRYAAAEAYLRPARRRRNLAVETEAFVHRVVVRGRRAESVEYEREGRLQRVSAAHEILLTAGAIGSPRVLLHSGIGPKRDLEALGIAVARDVPGVGANLIDHPYVQMTYTTRPADSLNAQLRGWRLMLNGARWLLNREGPLTIGASQAVAFVRTPNATRPDVQINFRPISFRFDTSGRLSADATARVTAAVCALRPLSRGRVSLKSADPRQSPVIACNYLQADADETALKEGVKWARRIFASEPLGSRVLAEDAPGAEGHTDEGLRQFIRGVTQTMCHPVGTCRMGRDPMAVVDQELRVQGIAGLRVIDSSVMPTIVSGNTAAATFMIAERGADFIRAGAQHG